MDKLLIIANLVLWVFVIGLAVVVFALARQIGVLYERIAPAGALMTNRKLEPGAVAPIVQVRDINTNTGFSIGGKRDRCQLVFFLSPDCPVCKTLLPILKSIRSAEADWMEIVFASDGDVSEHQSYIRQQGLSGDSYVLSRDLGMKYGVSKLPFAVLLDTKGVVASLGLVNSREHFESLFESMERGIPSLQAYMQDVTYSKARAVEQR